MRKIANIEEARAFIYHLTLTESKGMNQDELGELLLTCENFANTANDTALLCRTRIFLCNHYVQINDLQLALETGWSAKNMAHDHQLEEEELQSYSGLMATLSELGDYATFESLIFEYREKLENKQDFARLASSYIISGIQLDNLKETEKAIDNYETAFQYLNKFSNIEIEIILLNNYGKILIGFDNVKAEKMLKQAYALHFKFNAKQSYYSLLILDNLGKLYTSQSSYKSGISVFKKAIQIAKEINNINYVFNLYINISKLFVSSNSFSKAIYYLRLTEDILQKSSNKYLISDYYLTLSNLYQKKKKYKQAHEYFLKHYEVNQELYNESSNDKIRKLQILQDVKNIEKERDHAKMMANLKHDFLANMSHEIRTPINSVLGISYLLQQDQLTEKQLNYVRRLQFSGENLLHIINDVLDISKIEAGKMEICDEVFDFSTWLHLLYDQFSFRTEAKQLAFHLEEQTTNPLFVSGDSHRLTQIMLNLLSNAVKFTEAGSITLSSKTVKVEDNKLWLKLSVQDTGIGISQDRINQIFMPYEQANANIKNKYGGTGLGLAICVKLCELMHGEFTVNSKPDVGTTFSITLPLGFTSNIKIDSKEPSKDICIKNLNLLVVDDNEENRQLFHDLLLSINPAFTIQFAEHGKLAIDVLVNFKADIILMDLEMPVMNGIDAAMQIKKNNPNQKIIGHTASILALSKDEIMSLGFEYMLFKPFKIVELKQILDSISNCIVY